MKNMQVRKKLIVSFLIVTILAAAIGVTGILGMMKINKAGSGMYDNETEPLAYISKAIEEIQLMRIHLRDYIIAALHNDTAAIEKVYVSIEEENRGAMENLDLFEKSINNQELRSLFDEGRRLYDTSLQKCMQEMYQLAKAGDSEGAYDVMMEYSTDVRKAAADFEGCMNLKIQAAQDADKANNVLFAVMLVVIIAVLAAAVAISMFLALYISGMIGKPVMVLTGFMKKASSTGDITLSSEDIEVIGKYSQVKDDIGQCIAACAAFVGRITDVGKVLDCIAGGDLTAEIALLSDKDVLGRDLKKMIDNLNEIFSEISMSTDQVSTGANQVADGAQALAQGSTEQAASVEELSASIGEISNKTKQNANIAGEAAMLSNFIKTNAEKGNEQMDNLMRAVTEISDASHSISKVIKVIDEIAFQTNILALNAAVEAARAGQHGKGFAVVADEVRSLAAKSAESAKDTGVMIENSMGKAAMGLELATETLASLKEIVDGINQNAEIMNQIAQSSNEQASSISQINIGIDQVSQVIQQNSATAEESAAASEEMSSQASVLQGYIRRFKLKK